MIQSRILICLLLFFSFLSCKSTRGDSKVEEAWDAPNHPANFGVKALDYQTLSHPDWLEGQLKTQPWSDSYWPLPFVGLADRWIEDTEIPDFVFSASIAERDYQNKEHKSAFFAEIAPEIADALNQAKEMAAGDNWRETVFVSPAEKYDISAGDTEFSLTKQEINRFAENFWSYETRGISWGWMGHCHGWAPAAAVFSAPKHGVLATNSRTGKSVLFTPGDIRALLTKAASDHDFEGNIDYVGSRCRYHGNQVPRDELGRIIDGLIGDEWLASEQRFNNSRRIRLYSKTDNFFNFSQPEQKTLLFYFEKDSENSGVDHQLYALTFIGWKIDKVMAEIEIRPATLNHDGSLSLGELHTTSGNLLRYYKQCRDINAGAFHSVMATYLSKGGALRENREPIGFILDKTRDAEVWNHPVFAFRSKAGKPTPLKISDAKGNEFHDPYSTMRAEGTVMLVDVYTELRYAAENGPLIVYQAKDNTEEKVIYHYTLELDAGNRIIGGEWHGSKEMPFDSLKPASGLDLFAELSTLFKDPKAAVREFSPDFIWGLPQQANLVKTDKSPIDPTIVMSLYHCSLDDRGVAGQHEVHNLRFNFVNCPIP